MAALPRLITSATAYREWLFAAASSGVLSGQNSRHDRLHQTARVAAAISAHQTADAITGGVKSRYRLFFFIQNLAAAVDESSSHRERNSRHNFQPVKSRP